MAGLEFTLSCVISETISGLADMPTATWLNIDNQLVTSQNDITIKTSRASSVTTATLTFNPLKASHGQVYRCSGNLTSLLLGSPLQIFRDENLQVYSKWFQS